MVPVGISVSLSHYTCTVHYRYCPIWIRQVYLTHENQTVPPSVKWKLCSNCKPVKEDIVTVARDIRWLEKYGDAMTLVVKRLDFGVAEQIQERNRDGRTLTRKKHD